jgi:hypothetical protein
MVGFFIYPRGRPEISYIYLGNDPAYLYEVLMIVKYDHKRETRRNKSLPSPLSLLFHFHFAVGIAEKLPLRI